MKKTTKSKYITSALALKFDLRLSLASFALLSSVLQTYAIASNNLNSIVPNVENRVNLQELHIQGVVYDNTGMPLLGANVFQKGTSNGVQTDFDGKFELNLKGKDVILVISYVGFKSKEIAVGNQTSFTITLEEDVAGLDEVVVVGYGTQSRRSVTSSVSSIDVSEAVKAPTSSIAQSLSGRAAGLNVNLNSAQPGGAVSFQIRGAATGRSPLIVIDGMPTTGFSPTTVGQFGTGSLDGVLSSLNPNDIESIDILKDASATSIYGSKAAGGVILITTKRGKKGGESFAVDFNTTTGVQKYYNLPNMLEATDYMIESNRVQFEKWLYDSRKHVYEVVPKPVGWSAPGAYIPLYTDDQITEFENGTKKGTDFVGAVTRPGTVKNYDLSMRGSQKNTSFYASFGAFNQEGIIKNNNLSKYTGRVNVDQNLGEKTKAGVTINFSQINSDNVSIGNGGRFENSGILTSALQFDPTLPIRNESGSYQINERQSNFPNPVSLLEITNKTKMERFFANAFLEYKILPQLSIKTQVGFDRNQSESYGYLPTSTIAGLSTNGRADRAGNENTNGQFQALLNYNDTLGDSHHVSGTLGTEYMHYRWEGSGITATNFPYDGVQWNNLALAADRANIWSNGGSSEIISYFLRTSYDFDYKYFMTVNLRVDGSSNFSPKNQYGFFPGVSIGWDVTRESFMKGSSGWLNQLKLRAGYGETGNDNIGTAFTDYYSPGANTMWGNAVISGVQLAGLGNPDLKWEKQADLNFGIDFSMFNSRISGSLEYFNREISRILGNKNLLSSNPVSTLRYNLDAKKRTYGTELTLNTKNIENKDFSWGSNITFTYYRDQWLKRDPSYVLGINESPKQYFGEIWRYKSDGLVYFDTADELNQIPGTIKILDVNGYLLDDEGNRVVDENGKPQYSGEPDGKINDADKVKVGINTPFTIGFNNTFNYKKFDLSIYTYGVFNRWKENQTEIVFGGPSVMGMLNIASNMQENIVDRYNSDNRLGTGVSSLQSVAQHGTGDFFLEEAWFVRVRDITLGYTLPASVLEKIKLKKLRLYGNVMNPFLFTPYTGMDPETDAYVGAYPNQRTFNMGVQLTF
ncbi:SusC/RagA family TonB-linked outer membrane protein [Aestuariibaculum suncheonense]|uniref:TonB-dependent receptor n=1 Tax=Aestuariibaculum suncheonense TaxID=1028745 RepID=A0A8J6QDR7_9FLAO|nr:TonB-dependent receptor [Aestuariibaculum suncheonense]MBD0834747.1 TonB-dependent receptor [Aestuariibaculum suncheonense]